MIELRNPRQNTYVHFVSGETRVWLLLYRRSREGIATPLRATAGFAFFAYNQWVMVSGVDSN